MVVRAGVRAVTPFEIDILLWYYTRRVGDHPVVANNPPIWAETRQWFYAEQLLCASENTAHQITERGEVYCKGLQAVPLPVWRMP